MIDPNGKARCDREIGSAKRGWRVCQKPAPLNRITERIFTEAGVTYITMHYCDGHMDAAHKENTEWLNGTR